MYEVEVKLPADHTAVRRRLAELDAEPLGTVIQRDTYYDAPHREFAETDEALRIRRVSHGAGRSSGDDEGHGSGGDDDDGDGGDGGDDESDVAARAVDEGDGGGETRVTYKGPLVDADSKTRREHETGVDDGETMDAILRALGFEPAAVVEKERDRFRVGAYTVTLDDVTDLGEYVEVETGSDDVDSAREGAFALLADLGLDPDDQIRTSYLGLLLADED
ncbi:class IV adenylate cyclase [Salinigranum sp. GCM10025319]|uniref:class IV adenylate cyclase n=1 Tax=Salinigranum sp. GCM10025319 TaxID=3252687 RepID=UPI00360F32C0